MLLAFAHPIAVLALVLWILNDQLLKGMCPSWLTGKLSDVAGMIVTPILVAVVVERIAPRSVRSSKRFVTTTAWLSALVVGITFAATKTWTPANDAYVAIATALRIPLHALAMHFHPSVSSWREQVVLVKDPTDLLAIPFGGVSVWLLERSCGNPLMRSRGTVRAPEPRSIPSDA